MKTIRSQYGKKQRPLFYHTASRGKAAAFSSLAPETKPRSFLTEVLFWCMGKKEVVVVFITQALFGDFTIVLVAAP